MKKLIILFQFLIACWFLTGCSLQGVAPEEESLSPANASTPSRTDPNVALLASADIRGTFAGGPLYKPGYQTNITELRNSGLNTIIVWTIHIDASGNLNLNAEFPICSNGTWVGNNMYPDFPNSIALLKTAPTSINRIEICILGTTNGSFTNIKNLIASQGTGPTSTLYKNFNALKQNVPGITAVDFDDEGTYDNASSKSFAYMLGDLGYKVTMCPYTNSSYWNTLVSQINTARPGLVDRVYLQCYDGGASNNPCSWTVGGVPIYPGLWGGGSHMNPSQIQTKLSGWSSCLSGAWIWLYDDIIGSSASYNTAIVNGIGGTTPPGSDITGNGGTLSAQYTDSPAGEDIAKLTDNNTNTKYLTFHGSGWVQFQANTGAVVKSYTITSANDFPVRDPKNWTLQGSNNGTTWTTLNTQTNQSFASRFLKKTYTFTNTTSYTYYRLNVTAVGSGTIMQMAEWELLTN